MAIVTIVVVAAAEVKVTGIVVREETIGIGKEKGVVDMMIEEIVIGEETEIEIAIKSIVDTVEIEIVGE